eukprot:TRINITY_DN11162_c0_g1_i1.p1 TRINITY_DN11162_c0_g1~~TRINITY_DN11162_c0_g1_i1.p1  ORF type:complete len:209 (-),score=30.10 TRINITY_DN11162_c0_g1_i1:199-825(-)
MKMLERSFKGVDRFDVLRKQLQALGERHVAMGIPYHAFDKMWAAFDKSLKEVLPKDYTKLTQKSCKLIFSHLSDVMRSCYPPESADEGKVDEQEVLQSFWHHVIEEGDTVGHTMYDYLFEHHSKYEVYFSGDFGEQIRMFTEITKLLNKIIVHWHDFDTLKPELVKLAKFHLAMKIPLSGFIEMWSALDLAFNTYFRVRITRRGFGIL